MKSTKKILEELKEELQDRDLKIKKYKKENYELSLIKNDWIEKDLVKTNKVWPDDYIKQKKEWAEWKVYVEEKEKEFSEIIEKQQKRHKSDIVGLEMEIEYWKKIANQKSLLKRILG